MTEFKFEMYKGDDKSLYIQILNGKNEPLQLSSITEIEWLVVSTGKTLLRKTLSNNEIIIISATEGKFRVDVTHENSALISPSTYRMMARIQTNDNKKYTVLDGQIVIKSDT